MKPVKKKIERESIKTFWKLGYFKLYDWPDFPIQKREVSTGDYEWRQIFWRLYWRQK